MHTPFAGQSPLLLEQQPPQVHCSTWTPWLAYDFLDLLESTPPETSSSSSSSSPSFPGPHLPEIDVAPGAASTSASALAASPSPSSPPRSPRSTSSGSISQQVELVEVEYLDAYRDNVGMCVVNERGLVFAARRVDDPKGTWQMPQGGIDKGEDAKEAALRELEEETGIKASRVKFVGEVDEWLAYDFPTSVKQKLAKRAAKKKAFKKVVFKGQKQKWFLLKFDGSDSDIDLIARGEEHREFSEWCWVPLDHLSTQIVHFKKEVYEEVSKSFCPLIQDL
mmetsp:Transcript_14555/g.28143  ORF Transcript_14555/g.28143 Transcript_14555/m.28143 type:complete len:279 (-) Transcript_14555:130-966(-)